MKPVNLNSALLFGNTCQAVLNGDVCPCCFKVKENGEWACMTCLNNYGKQNIRKSFAFIMKAGSLLVSGEKMDPTRETVLKKVICNFKVDNDASWDNKKNLLILCRNFNGGNIKIFVKGGGINYRYRGESVTCLVTGRVNGDVPYLNAMYLPGVTASVKLRVNSGFNDEGMTEKLPVWEINEVIKRAGGRKKIIKCSIGFSNEKK